MIEVRSIDHIPESERRGTVAQQGPFWFVVNFQPVSLALGFVGPAMGLSLFWTIIASVLGGAVGTVFVACHATQGANLGLPQMIQSRAQFGYRGVLIPMLGTGFTFLGYNMVNLVVIKSGASAIFGVNPVVITVAATIAGTALAVFGHHLLHRVLRFLFWVSLPLWLALTVGLLAGRAPEVLSGAPTGLSALAFATQFTVTASYALSGAPFVSDYTRYLPRTTKPLHIIAAVFLGSVGSPFWLVPLGAWMAIRLGARDALAGIGMAGDAVLPGLGGALVVLSVAVLVALIGINTYSGMLTVITAVDSLRPVRPTATLRTMGIGLFSALSLAGGLLLADSTATLEVILLCMLYLLTPWTAINLTDYFLVRKGHYQLSDFFTPTGTYGRWSRPGLIAYGAGVLAQIPFIVLPFYTGPAAVALGRVDYSFVVGLAVPAGLYLLVAAGPRERSVRRSD